ncbi:MAG: SDR family NAD(P)-dependent oxidoreductase, partial [Planctomycetaceae bacterium]
GDDNPMHVDAIIARRLLFGGPVVHGIHAVCCALASWLRTRPAAVRLRSLNVVFLKPMRVDQPVVFLIEKETDETVQLRITAAGQLVTRIVCEFEAQRENIFSDRVPDMAAALGTCQTRHEYQHASGSLPLLLPRDSARRQIPELLTHLPAGQTALLLATTRLVGTVCPGLHSIYSALQLTFQDPPSGTADTTEAAPHPVTGSTPAMNWKVSSYDPRFGSLSLHLDSPIATGSIRAFVRPGPREQASFSEVRKLVKPGSFSGIQALVVGGSRGFGEVCAKLLAAGGADVRITFHSGAGDAQRVVEEICGGGGRACATQLDVTSLDAGLPASTTDNRAPTHLFYFATPPIARAVKNRFSSDLFREFCSYYVDALVTLVEELTPLGLRGLYYPSSVFVSELPSGMGEYAAAKAAGESLCAFLDRMQPDLQVLAPRLPKSATDQTASLVPAKIEDPALVLIDTLQPFMV